MNTVYSGSRRTVGVAATAVGAEEAVAAVATEEASHHVRDGMHSVERVPRREPVDSVLVFKFQGLLKFFIN